MSELKTYTIQYYNWFDFIKHLRKKFPTFPTNHFSDEMFDGNLKGNDSYMSISLSHVKEIGIKDDDYETTESPFWNDWPEVLEYLIVEIYKSKYLCTFWVCW